MKITGTSRGQQRTRGDSRGGTGEIQSAVGNVGGRRVLVGERGAERRIPQLRRNRYLTVKDLGRQLEDVGDGDLGNGTSLAQRRAVERARGSQPVAGKNPVPELRDSDPLGRVDLEHASEDGVQFRGKRKN